MSTRGILGSRPRLPGCPAGAFRTPQVCSSDRSTPQPSPGSKACTPAVPCGACNSRGQAGADSRSPRSQHGPSIGGQLGKLARCAGFHLRASRHRTGAWTHPLAMQAHGLLAPGAEGVCQQRAHPFFNKVGRCVGRGCGPQAWPQCAAANLKPGAALPPPPPPPPLSPAPRPALQVSQRSETPTSSADEADLANKTVITSPL